MVEATRILQSGEALKKFRAILKAQYGDPDLSSESMKNPAHNKKILSTQSGTIESVNNFNLSALAKILGAPKDQYAGLQMHKRKGEKIDNKEPMFTFYSSNEQALQEAIDTLQYFPIYKIG